MPANQNLNKSLYINIYVFLILSYYYMKSDKKGLGRIFNAAKFSFQGLAATFKSEAAFRQDCALGGVLFFLAFVFDISSAERCALIIPLFILLIAEILNSAIEKCVDMISPEFNPLAKFAKDAGSAAVFIALVNIAVCWGIIFIK